MRPPCIEPDLGLHFRILSKQTMLSGMTVADLILMLIPDLDGIVPDDVV